MQQEEVMAQVTGRILSLCFVRFAGTPLVNSIEVRPMPAGSYPFPAASVDNLLLWWRLFASNDAYAPPIR